MDPKNSWNSSQFSKSGMFLSDRSVQLLIGHQAKSKDFEQELLSFFSLVKSDVSERRYFSTSQNLIVEFLRLLHAPAVDQQNLSIMFDILLFISEEDYKHDRAGIRNMIDCEFIVNEWDKNIAIIDKLIDNRNAKLFRETSRLFTLYMLANEIWWQSVSDDQQKILLIRANRLIRALGVFRDVETLQSILECMWTIAMKYDEIHSCIVQNNGESLILEVIRHNRHESIVCQFGLQILNTLTERLVISSPNLFVGKHGLYRVVMKCMSQHMHCEKLIDSGCVMLRKALVKRVEDIDDVKGGGLQGIIEKVKATHTGNPIIQMNASQLLYVIQNPQSPSGCSSSSSHCSTPRVKRGKGGMSRRNRDLHRRGRSQIYAPVEQPALRNRRSSRKMSKFSLDQNDSDSSQNSKDSDADVLKTRALLTPRGRAAVRERFLESRKH